MASYGDGKKNHEDEAIHRLRDQIALIELSRNREPRTPFELSLVLRTFYSGTYWLMCPWTPTHKFTLNRVSPRSPVENRARAKDVFGMLMRAGFRRESGDNAFQPCEDDLEFLKGMDPALCMTLRGGSLVDFCRILHPVDSVLTQTIVDVRKPLDDQTIKSSLRRKDSIFHLHGNKMEDNFKEFKDLTLRADALAETIVKHCDEYQPVTVHLLDGHGRMLVCIIKALMDLGLDSDDESLQMRVFEIDDQVHKYHQYVFPRCVEKRKESIISCTPALHSVIYLNFCSVTSGKDDEAWKNHFRSQTIAKWVPHCCKENVLKYIWKVTHPPYYCTVMVSLVIKDVKENGAIYHDHFRSSLGDYITGLGFLYLLRKEDLFDAEIVSVRPECGIIWRDADKRKPENLSSGGWGHPFVTLLVRPKQTNTPELADEELGKLHDEFEEWEIADLREETMQIGATVQVTCGKYAGGIGKIITRTAAMLEIEGIPNRVRLSLCEPL